MSMKAINVMMMFIISVIFICAAATKANCQDEYQPTQKSIGTPTGLFLFAVSSDDSETSSKIIGGELQVNIKKSDFPLAIGLHGQYQKQSFTDFGISRWGLGASINNYIPVGPTTMYAGLKRMFYFGGGKNEEALDCLYCSDVEEKYSSREDYASIGIIYNHFVIQVDKRISNNKGHWSESANDPYGVGRSYNKSMDIPGPDIIFNIGLGF